MSRNEELEPTVEDLQGLRFFADLNEHQLASIIALAHLEQVPAGMLLFQEEEPADAVRVIRTGRVTLSIRVPGHPEAVVSTLSRGQLLGFSALLPESRWSASARSLKPCSLIAIPGSRLAKLCETEHSIGFHLMRNALRSVAAQLRDARLQVLDIFGQQSAESG